MHITFSYFQRIFPELIQLSTLRRSHISFLALNTLHEKGEAWERHDLRAAGKPKKILCRGVSDSDFTASPPHPPLLVCQNFPAAEMISQASCVFVRTAAVGAVLLGVVDGDNVAPWLELTTTESAAVACSTSGEEKGGRRGKTLPAAY